MTLLKVEGLKAGFETTDGSVTVVDDVSFDIKESEIFALVGESGCGKSVTAYSILNLLLPPGKIFAGHIFFQNEDLLSIDLKRLNDIRGRKIGMVFQEPSSFLNPVFTIGEQIVETMIFHKVVQNISQAKKKAISFLERVGIPFAEKRFYSYPHELSGGMKQRSMIAMALSCNPELLIADEPTTALDVTVQDQIMNLLEELQKEFKMSVLLITHNLSLVAERAERVAVMYAGKIVEETKTELLLEKPLHPYTQGLIKSVPDITLKEKKLYSIPGVVPVPGKMPQGCRFSNRCPIASDICKKKEPVLENIESDRRVACFFAGEQI